jgi:aspartyl protease family protein
VSENTTMNAILYALILILPLSALIARRLPIGQAAKMALAWTAIFALLLLLVGQRERLRPLWTGVDTFIGGYEQSVSGKTVRIAMSDDGHFYATARINGHDTRLLIDSGATTTALNARTARAAGIKISDPFGVRINTANGRIVARRAEITTLELGNIRAHSLPVVVAEEFGDTDVLGMNFLSRLRGWRVEGRSLILEPAS